MHSHIRYAVPLLVLSSTRVIHACLYTGVSSLSTMVYDFKLDQWGLTRKPKESFTSYMDRVYFMAALLASPVISCTRVGCLHVCMHVPCGECRLHHRAVPWLQVLASPIWADNITDLSSYDLALDGAAHMNGIAKASITHGPLANFYIFWTSKYRQR